MQGELSSVLSERIVEDDAEVVRQTKDTPPFNPYVKILFYLELKYIFYLCNFFSYGYPQYLHDQGPFNTALEMTGGSESVSEL
jgi:hypothetical protein